jgi:hypothetical protein
MYSCTPFEQKHLPEEVLDDPIRRRPLLNVMGTGEFKELRSRIQVQGPLEWVSNSLLVGQGCRAHACTFSEGVFVFDVVQDRAWAMYFEREESGVSGKRFGSLGPQDAVPRRVLERWVIDRKLNWEQFDVLQHDPSVEAPGKEP